MKLLTIPMLRLLPSKAQGSKDFGKPSKPCHVGIQWRALAEYSQMNTHVLKSFSHFFLRILHHFVFAKLTTSNVRVNNNLCKIS